MIPFRTEIRNAPREQTIKVYLSDCDMNEQLKERLTNLYGIKSIEIQKRLHSKRAVIYCKPCYFSSFYSF